MKTKQQFYNAGLTKTLFRSFLGVLWLFIFYFLWLWASFDRHGAFWVSTSMLLVGPFLLFPLLFAWRFLGSARLKWREHDALAETYLSQILREPGPRLRMWTERDESVPTLFWIENPFLRFSRQEVFVSPGWLQMSASQKRESLLKVWDEIGTFTRAQRFLRTFQIAYWVGLLWPVEIIFALFQRLQTFLGLDDLPVLSFWVQRLANSFKKFLLNEKSDTNENLFRKARLPEGESFQMPAVWSSVLWGPWYHNCSENKHPLWNFLGFD